MKVIDAMQKEAIQVAASCVAILECIDRMSEKGYAPESGREGYDNEND